MKEKVLDLIRKTYFNETSFVNGRFLKASGLPKKLTNSYLGLPHAQVFSASKKDVDLAFSSCSEAFLNSKWRKNPDLRSRTLFRLASKLEEDFENLALAETLDSGKTFHESKVDISLAKQILEFYATEVEKYKFHEKLQVASDESMLLETVKRPYPCSLLLTPWNFPLVQSVVKIAACLAAGGSMICKPSISAPSTTLKLAEYASTSGVPDGVLNVILGSGEETGSLLLSNKGVSKVFFTGSEEVGKKVLRHCAEALVPSSIELGGKGGILVFPDACEFDLDEVVNQVVSGFCASSGQVCSATTRLVIQESVYEKVKAKLLKRVSQLVCGNPFEKKTDMGPLISMSQKHKVLKAIENAKLDKNLRLLLDSVYDSSHPLVRPAVFELAGDPKSSELWQEEIFGPVLVLARFSSESEGIELLNSTRFGLGNSILTRDEKLAKRVRDSVEGGIFWTNCNQEIPPEAPFGGVKKSGFGREFGLEGLSDYLYVKTYLTKLLPSDMSKK